MPFEVNSGNPALIRGASLQPDNFFTQCKDTLGRVFLPSRTPIRVEAYINSNMGGAGLIGTDQRMNYTSHLTTSEGKLIPLQKRDFHIVLKSHPVKPSWVLRIIEFVLTKIFFFLQPKRPIEEPWVLPSAIFHEAKENDILRFRWDGRLFEYRLKQQNHTAPEGRTNFESFFQTLQAFMKDKVRCECPYLFVEDAPPLYSFELNNLFSKNAQIYSPATKALSSFTFNHLQKLNKNLSKAERLAITWYEHEDSSFTLVFDAPGVSEKNISLLLDRRYLLILVQKKDEWAPKGTVIENSRSKYTYRALELPGNIDPDTINLELLYGVVRMTYRLKASPQIASQIES